MEFSSLAAFRFDDNRRSLKTEVLAQPVDQKALERKVHFVGLVGEHNERRGADRRLGDVVNSNVAFEFQGFNKAIQFAGSDALGCRLKPMFDRREDPSNSFRILCRGE